jgi:hypothetical protein
MERTHLTKPTVNADFDQLMKLGIVEEITRKKRGRVYAYRDYLSILNEGGAPLSATRRSDTPTAARAPPKRHSRKRASSSKAMRN